jgi:outer membrane protein OmpA-like peptidoglycan-associated protein
MKKLPLGLFGAMVVVTACQTTPPPNPALEDARKAVNAAAADPAVNAGAGQDLQRARDALVAAESAWKAGDQEETSARAYIANQRANIALETGARYTTEQRLKEVSAERDHIRTEARTREVQVAESHAAQANEQAANAQAQAANAQAQAASAQAQAEAERQRADAQAQQLDEERARSARVQQDLQELAAKSTARGLVVTLQGVLFDPGKAQLRSGGVHELERVAGVMKNHPERRVRIEGFTDNQGDEKYNVELSRRRADAVRSRLEAFGVPETRVETRGYGEAYPVADNSTPSGRQQNRRVEIVFSDSNGQFGPR